jgi:hypothetical protein
MTIFIQRGDDPLSVRQASERGLAYVSRELSAAGARMGDETLLMMIPHEDLPERLQAVVTALGHETYTGYAAAWEADNAVNGANNIYNHQLVAYLTAVERLAQYRLADGLPEVIEDEEVIQASIAPLPATVEPDETPNPAIVQDDAERAVAEAIVSNWEGTPE